MRHTTALSLVFFAAFLLIVQPVFGSGKLEAEKVVESASLVVKSFGADPDLDWFRKNVKNAKALLIIPQSLKGAFLIGGAGGTGVLMAQDHKTGEWGNPAFYTMGSLSVGLQIGAESSEVILMIMTDRGMEKLLASSFKLGADVTMALGPVGGGTSAKTADVLSYARSKGAFVGVSLDGAVVKTRDKRNEDYYGSAVSPTDILIRKTVSNPHADVLRDAIVELTR